MSESACPIRPTETLEFIMASFRYLASLGRFADRRLGEVFISAPKSGSDMAAAARDSCIVASIAFQFGVPPQVIRHGLGKNSDGSAASPLGALFDLLAARG